MKNLVIKYPFWFFILLSVALRALSFNYTVIDHDESTYLVIANQLLKGDILYVDVWDTKPPGIFLIFAGFIAIFGKYIWTIRLMTAIVIGISAYFLYALKLHLDKQKGASLVAGVAFIIFCSAYRFGMASNTEMYFGLAAISGLYMYLVKNKQFLAGLIWGIGYVIKYVIVFDLFSFWLAITAVTLFGGLQVNWKKAVLHHLLLLSGFVLPFGLTVLYYWFNDLQSTFFEASFIIPARYQSEIFLTDVLNCILDFHLKFLPFIILFYYSVLIGLKKELKSQLSLLLPLLWFIFAFLSVIIPGKYFTHYYLQLALPTAWVISNAFNNNHQYLHQLLKHERFSLSVIFLVFGLIAANQSYFFTHPDRAEIIKNEIYADVNPNSVIYAGEKYQVLYYLLDLNPPTKYVHPTLLINPSHVKTLNLDANKEFNIILEKKPQYIVYHNFIRNGVLSKELNKNYSNVQLHSEWDIYYYKRKKGHLPE